jgi:hypothetical protein
LANFADENVSNIAMPYLLPFFLALATLGCMTQQVRER